MQFEESLNVLLGYIIIELSCLLLQHPHFANMKFCFPMTLFQLEGEESIHFMYKDVTCYYLIHSSAKAVIISIHILTIPPKWHSW